MRFLADMGVSNLVVKALRSRGYDIVHLRERGLQRLPDGEILMLARNEKRIILTFDLDFGELMSVGAERLPSIIIFRLRNLARSSTLEERLLQLFETGATDLRAGSIVIVEDARHRVRRLPLWGESDPGT